MFWTVQVSALLAFAVPFTWAMLGLWAASHFLRAIGLTLAFHRYFAHRAFQMNRGARFVWAFIGTAAMQKGPLWWAGHHVNHHKFADRDGDPHSPAVSGVYYAHIGWFLNDARHDRVEASNPVIRDFSTAPEIVWLDRYFFVPPLLLAAALYLVGGLQWLVWGFCVPTVTLAHATFAINTVNHMFGSRRFDTHRRLAQQRAHGVLRRRRGLAQQPPPLSARRAQRLLLVGIRSDVVRDPRHAGRRPRVGRAARARAHLRRSAAAEPRREPARYHRPWFRDRSRGRSRRCPRVGLPDRPDRVGVACSTKIIDPLQLDGNRLIVNNRTTNDWNHVEIRVNRYYRIAVPTILAGQRFDASLDAFLDVYGNHFYYRRQQIKDVHLTAKLPSGEPVDMHMDFHRSGLAGLADVGRVRQEERETVMARLKSEIEVTCPCCQLDAHRRPQPRPRRVAQGTRAREQARARATRTGSWPTRRRGAKRSSSSRSIRENARRRAVEALRGGAEAGAPGAGHETHSRFRLGLNSAGSSVHRSRRDTAPA